MYFYQLTIFFKEHIHPFENIVKSLLFWPVLLFTVYCLFLAFFRSFFLNKFLKKEFRTGISYWQILKVMWILRKTPRGTKKDKYFSFIELAILSSHGEAFKTFRKDSKKTIPIIDSNFPRYSDITQFWDDFIEVFDQKLKRLARPSDPIKIELKSVSDIEGDKVKEVIIAYFDFRKIFLPKKSSEILKFVSLVHIEQAYAFPAIPIVNEIDGYNNRVQKNMRKKREYMKSDSGNCINDISTGCKKIDLDLFFTYEWLLWKPSIQVVETPKGKMQISQVGMSDEAESVPIIFRTKTFGNSLSFEGDRFWNGINGGIDKNTSPVFGKMCVLDVHICDTVSFFAHESGSFEKCYSSFIKQYNHQNNQPFILEHVTHSFIEKHHSFFTAYLWIMFEMVNEKKRKRFDFDKLLVFWEHANVADEKSYRFLVERLLDKVFAYFESVFRDCNNCEKKYYYTLAMHPEIRKLFETRMENAIVSGNKIRYFFENKIKLTPRFNQDEILEGIAQVIQESMESDSFCDEHDMKRKTNHACMFYEIDTTKASDISLLCDFYRQMLKPYFPIDAERESLDNILEYLDQKSKGVFGQIGDNYHLLLCLSNKDIVGGAVLDYSDRCKCGFLEYIVVDKNARGKNIPNESGIELTVAKMLHQQVVKLLEHDTKRSGSTPLNAIVAEIHLNTNDKSPQAIGKRLFFKSLGYRKLKFKYTQPSLNLNGSAVAGLDLCVCVFRNDWESGIPARFLAEMICEYATIAMRIETPINNPVIGDMLDCLNVANDEVIGFEEIVA